MLADDSADYPRNFSLILQLHERLDEKRLREAIEAATVRHPLLRAVVEYNGDRPCKWVECSNPRYELTWADEPRDAAEPLRPFDLQHEPGVRFHVRRQPDGDALHVEFHHATTDGVGAIQFVGDLLTLYHGAAPTPLDPARLTTRDAFGLTGWRRPIRWIYTAFGWLGAIEFLIHHPAPLGKIDPGVADHRASGFCSFSFSESDTSVLIQAAKHAKVTLNDLLMCDLFVTLQAFVESHWPDRAKSHLRIMVPTNLRSAADDVLPAANVVAMVNIERRTYRWTDRERMLRVLHRELAAVKRLKLGVIFVQILSMLQWIFGSLDRFLPRDRCQATCVASNLGVVLPQIGGDVIRAVEFYPPIRPLTAAAFGIATHAGRLTISLHYDEAAMTVAQGQELLDRFIEQLQETGGLVKCAASGRWYSPATAVRSADS
jgi:NRPS condensation-like uncharacterized protein